MSYKEITLINQLLRNNGDVKYYDYECKGYVISVRDIYNTTEMAIIKYPTHFTPILTYFRTNGVTNGAYVEWRETLQGNDWKEFAEEVQKVQEIVNFFENNIESLQQGIIPDK